ncbi:sulfatase-like hydrolase/transferase [Tichowtungia aerotolerans]|uniref:Sulfatase-like hydrolase/transferase n=1 Tax=Tichowtungia aerotolerans TaxID=2697043 RepID=A0A6P1M653_9BACT|nr:sulfatase-like hydrolase/transferase [Tichowtungia aerotolerans]QHI68483.1 sulfatase-like hydrolase/transferase [Tichowtungia aerotolerans]
MRQIKTVLLLAVLGWLFAESTAAAPNIIMILIDDMGWADSSTYGSEFYQTPNLTRLAKEGMLFTDAYAAAPLCSPTRASIMSGQYPARLRMTQAITPKDVPEPQALPPKGNEYCGLVQNKNHMPLEVFTLAEALKEEGYNTAHIGKWHLTSSNPGWNGGDSTYNAENQGFDYVIGGGHLPGPPDYYSPYTGNKKSRQGGIRNLKPGPEGEYLNERLAEESIKWMDSVKGSGKPFYLNFWHYAVHGPVIAKKDLLPKYNERRDPENPQRCPEMATMLDSMDNSIGMLLDWLDKPENRTLKENTVVIVTSDNGGVIHNDVNGNPWTSNRPLRGGKANTYEGGVREPWIVRWPGVTRPGSVCSTSVQSIDIYPTVLEMVGTKPSKDVLLDGQSIVPLLKGQMMAHQPIFTHFPHYMGVLCAPSTSVRAGDYKLIRYYYAGDNAASHAYELFDLKRDPSEAINLAAYFPERVKELDRLIDSFLKETDALVPVRNENYSGDPQLNRTRQAVKNAPDRPQNLRLPEAVIKTEKAGSRCLQLLDQDNQPRKTHALVVDGGEWVHVENNPDGSVLVQWDVIPNDETVRVLFGWKGGEIPHEINLATIPPCELVIGPLATSSELRPKIQQTVSWSVDVSPNETEVVSAPDNAVWSEGFNSDFSNPYAKGSFGPQFGVTTPGIVTDGSLAGVEGDGFAALNLKRKETNGKAKQFGGMDVSLGTVTDAGVTYTFSGKFGWRYGKPASARDLEIIKEFSGFLIGGKRPASMVTPAFNFGELPQKQLKDYRFSYTTQPDDVGKTIGLRLRLVDLNKVTGLTQFLTDGWAVTAAPAEAAAGVRLPGIFSDGMVLQADAPVQVWGRAEPGDAITVEFAGQKKTAKTNDEGTWQVTLDPMSVSSNPRRMTVSSTRNSELETLNFSNVLVGEVWLCAGQSNMRMTVRGVTNAGKEMSNADFPGIRFFTTPAIGHEEPQEDVDANWTVCSPQSVGNSTATGYFFGRKLHQDLNVPIGLVDISYGGAVIATFMDAETVRHTPANELIYQKDQTFLNAKKLREQGISSRCYNAMVAPVAPYSVRGTIWYQGEANVGTPDEYVTWYRDYMNMMRTKFKNPDMPFYHVQLAGFENQLKPKPTNVPPEVWARFRLAQEEILQFPHTAMATAMDIGMKENIHPKNKQEVGRRLALCALNKTYGKTDVICEGPRVKVLKKKGAKVAVTFFNCGDGLKLNGDFGGFSGLLEDGTSIALSGRITGADTVAIDLAGQAVTHLRYAYANYPDCPLVNGAGLPAFPFEQPVN